MGKLAVPDICMGVVLVFAVFGMERSVVLMDSMDVGAAMRWTISVVNLVIILFSFFNFFMYCDTQRLFFYFELHGKSV